MLPTQAEQRLGFTVQTLTYPEGSYELSGLRAAGRSRLERTVALTLASGSRIRRRHQGGGYVLEAPDGDVWRVTAEFATPDEVAASDAYRQALACSEDGETTAETE